MKISRLIILISVLAVSVFTSCETEIEFNGDEKASLMVINGYFTPDSVVKVQVTKSKFFLKDDSSFDNVNDATIELWVNNQLKEMMQFQGNGVYTGTYTPHEGDSIRVLASNAAYQNVSCATRIPYKVSLTLGDTISTEGEIYYSISQFYDQYGGVTIDTISSMSTIKLNITVNLSDPDTENYYKLDVKVRRTYDSGDVQEGNIYFYSNDLVFGSVDEGQLIGETSQSYYHEFNDEIFNGKEYPLSFYIEFYNTVYYNDVNNPKNPYDGGVQTNEVVKKELIVSVKSISKPYYLYMKSRNASNNEIDFFSEPVQIYSNVKGGIGILGGYTKSDLIFTIPNSYDDYGFYSAY